MTRKEQIIEHGKKQGKTQEQINVAVAKYESTLKPKSGAGEDISQAFQGGIDYFKQGVEKAKRAKTPLGSLEAGLQQGAGLVGAAFSPLAPATKYIGQGIEAAGNKVAEIGGEDYQNFAMSEVGQGTARAAENVQNATTLLSLKGAGAPLKGPIKAPTVKNVPRPPAPKAPPGGGGIPGAIRDMTPTKEGIINHQIAQSFNLTPGDLTYISDVSKGNISVGKWLADNNLIGGNADETKALIQGLNDTSYKAVRDEIAAVPKRYNTEDVPRYKTILSQIQSQVDGIPGLEEAWLKANEYLKKNEIELTDVQAVKEMVDKRYSLYKKSGDRKDGEIADGMANMRAEIQKFIEDEVRENSGTDIHTLNNDVRTANAVLESIDTRASKTFTRGNWRPGDLQTLGFASFAGGALVGIAALFVKKVLETPTIALKIAKYVDKLSDARKARLLKDMQEGKIPDDFRRIINIKYQGQRLLPGMLTSQQATTSTNTSNSSITEQ